MTHCLKYQTVFIDESGVSDSLQNPQPFFGTGFLKVYNPDSVNRQLMQFNYAVRSQAKNLRKQLLIDLKHSARTLNHTELNLLLASTRHYEFHFADLGFDKIDIYKGFIDTLFQNDFHFCALIADKKHPNYDSVLYGDYWDSNIRNIKLLCNSTNLGEDEQATIIADFTHKPNSSTKEFHDELIQHPQINNAMMFQSVGVPLLQACDILLGCVIFDNKVSQGLAVHSRRMQAKQEVLKYLKVKLNMAKDESFSRELIVTGRQYFCVSHYDFEEILRKERGGCSDH